MTGAVLAVSLGACKAGELRAERSLEQQGFVRTVGFEWEGGSMQSWTSPSPGESEPALECSVHTDQGFAACVGPLWYRSRFGAAALRLLMADLAKASTGAGPMPGLDDASLRGSHVIFVRVLGRAWLINDALGLARVLMSQDRRYLSTSWLAARAYVGNDEIDEAAAIEYVLQGASHSNSTVARGVSKLPLGEVIDLDAGQPRRRSASQAWSPDAAHAGQALGAPYASIDEAVDALTAHLRRVFGEASAAFPGRLSAALSGGFDSRLIVAGLLDQGERPRLFVYGSAGSEDVVIARDVAGAEGMELVVVDKDALDGSERPPDLDALVESALFLDGLPNDGIYDPGSDRRTRLEQGAGGYLVLNGGGGEIFRNFFHLPDRRYRARSIVQAFYRGFDPGVFRRPRGLRDYQQSLARSMHEVLGLDTSSPDRVLSRAQVELLYPLFRCHHWMGVNNSLALRHVQFTTPLLDVQTVSAAATLPLSWKDAGLFESRLIAALHAGVAGRPSSYGFRFSDGPHARARRIERLTSMRPVFARPMINAVRRRLHGLRASPGLIERCRDLLPGEWRVDPLLRLDRLPDDSALSRALAIEVVSRKLTP